MMKETRSKQHHNSIFGYIWLLAIRYMRSKKQAFISVGTLFAIMGVSLGVAALAVVMSVTGGFHKQFRDKVLGVNAHVLVLKRVPEFREYRSIMSKVSSVPGVVAVAPFTINPMLVTAGDRVATGVLMKGVDPERTNSVLDLPKHILPPAQASIVAQLRRPGSKPPETPSFQVPPTPSSSTSASIGIIELLPELSSSASVESVQNKKVTPAPSTVTSQLPQGSFVPKGGYNPLPDDDQEIVNRIRRSENKSQDLPGVILGITLAKTLNVNLGDRINITSPSVGLSFLSPSRAPVSREFKVIALFEAGFDQYDSKLVYVDLYEAQKFYEQGDSVTGVEMRIEDIDRSRKVKHQIESLLKSGIYHVMDWEELNHSIFTALRIQQFLMSAVLTLIIIVAAFTVVATLIMIVLDKRKEIAVLKAMGARDGAILRVFLYQGLMIGTIGTTLGLLLGFIVCRGLFVYGFPLDPKVYFISKLPVEARFDEFALIGLIAMVICMVATLVPALHASLIRPAEGLRSQ